jgi:peroxiredoxin
MSKGFAGKVFSMSLAILMFLLIVSCQSEKGPKRGDVVPDLELEKIDGKKIKLSDFKGKIVMLYFWADWCPACKKEFPETQAYYNKLKKEDFEIIAVNVGQPKSVSENFAENFGAEFIMTCDESKTIAQTYGVDDKLPVNFFINKKGEIIRRINGWVDENQVNVIIHQNQ